MNIYEVLLKPVITEKSTLLQDEGRYTFQVALKANKGLVKEAVEKNFNVTVVDVNITMLRGKSKRYGPKVKKTPDTKKAIVTLKAGERINLVEGL